MLPSGLSAYTAGEGIYLAFHTGLQQLLQRPVELPCGPILRSEVIRIANPHDCEVSRPSHLTQSVAVSEQLTGS